MTIADLQVGETACIVEISGKQIIRQRLNDFGIREGEEVTVIRVAPLADPIELKVGGGYMSLRKAEAAKVRVHRIK